MRGHQLEREPVFVRHPLVILGSPARGTAVGGDLGSRSLLDRGREPGVIEVMVRDQHKLDVLDPQAVPGQLRLERGERLVANGPGVDQRQRVAVQQPDVDRAEPRHRQGELRRLAHAP